MIGGNPIPQAKNTTLFQTTSMPDVSLALSRLLSPLIFEKLQETNNNGFLQKIPLRIATMGSIQPLSPRELKVKPEGERAWGWYQLHTAVNVDLLPNDRIRLADGTLYKVMAKINYFRSGYFEFHVIQDFDNGDWE